MYYIHADYSWGSTTYVFDYNNLDLNIEHAKEVRKDKDCRQCEVLQVVKEAQHKVQ